MDQSALIQLKTERSICEKLLVGSFLTDNTKLVNFDVERIKNLNLRVIATQLGTLSSLGIKITREVVSLYAIPRLVSNTTSEECCLKLIDDLFALAGSSNQDIELYEKTLIEIESKESLLDLAGTISERVTNGDNSIDIASLGKIISGIADRSISYKPADNLNVAYENLMSQIEEARRSEAEIGIPYPTSILNNVLHTLYPTDLVVLAARPSIGKTAFALNICRNTEEPIGFFSSEMTKEQCAIRFVSMDSGLTADVIRNPKKLSEQDLKLLKASWSKNQNKKLYIEDKGSITIEEIIRISTQWVNLYGIKLVIVDYAQRINTEKQFNSEREKIGYIAKSLKELAKELGVCVLLLAQINRESVKLNRRPETHDIKGSGDIEQEADSIMILHKPYTKNKHILNRISLEAIIPKNRHGRQGIALLDFDPIWLRFVDIDTPMLN